MATNAMAKADDCKSSTHPNDDNPSSVQDPLIHVASKSTKPPPTSTMFSNINLPANDTLLPPMPKPWLNLGFHLSHHFLFLIHSTLYPSCLMIKLIRTGQTDDISLMFNYDWELSCFVGLAVCNVIWWLSYSDSTTSLERRIHKNIFMLYSTMSLVLPSLLAKRIFVLPLHIIMYIILLAWFAGFQSFILAASVIMPVPPLSSSLSSSSSPAKSHTPRIVYTCSMAFSPISRTMFCVGHLQIILIFLLILRAETITHTTYMVNTIFLFFSFLSVIAFLERFSMGLQVRSDGSVVVEKFARNIVIHQVTGAYCASPNQVKQITHWARVHGPGRMCLKLPHLVSFATNQNPNHVVVLVFEGRLLSVIPPFTILGKEFIKDCARPCETLASPEHVPEFLRVMAHVIQQHTTATTRMTADATTEMV